MSTCRSRLLLCIVPLALACGAGKPGAGSATVPTIEVKKQRFQRIVTAEGQLRPVRATPVTLPSDVEWSLRITWLAPDGSMVKKGDQVARFDDLEIKSHLADAESDQAVAAAKRRKEQILLEAASQDRQRTTEASQRELAMAHTFQRKDSAIFSRDQIIESEIDEKYQEAKVDHARKSEVVDRRLGQNKLGLIDVEAKKASEAIRRSQRGLHALQITAPHDGIFTVRRNSSGEPTRVGDTAYRSMSVAEISVVEKMEAEVFVLEAEAAGLAEGRKAELVIEAQPDRIFGCKVKQVETVAKRRQQKSPTQYFGVILSLEQTMPELMKPGQRVRVRLFLHEEEALVVPRPALFDREGHWVAYRRDAAGAFAPVQVKLGPSTAGLVTIESGLSSGDVVALREPGKAVDDLLPAAAKPGSRAR